MPILGYSQILRTKHQQLGDNILSKIRRIEDSALGVQSVLSSLIGMARQKNLKLEKVELEKTLETVLSILEYEMRERGIQLSKTFDPSMPVLELDHELIEQAFLTLLQYVLTNLKETAQLNIGIMTRWANGKAIVEVSSNIELVTEEEQNILLDPFGTMRQLDDARILNLLVVSEIIKAHRGLIEIKNENNEYILRIVLAKNARAI